MRTEALEALGKNALTFAQCYTRLVEAMMAEGVPERIARIDARLAAIAMAIYGHEASCPICGHKMTKGA